MTLLPALQLQSTADLAPTFGASGGPDLGWLLATVTVFVVTIAGLAFLFKKVVGGSLRARASKRDLHVLDVLPLGNKRQLAVVRCYDRTFALGLGEKSVDLVAELDSGAIDHDRQAAEGAADAPFTARLEQARARLLGARGPEPRELEPRELEPQPPRPGRQVPPGGATTAASDSGSREFIA